MSFLFGKKHKQQSNALPPATRELSSSHGQGPPGASAPNGAGPRDFDKARGAPSAQGQPPGSTPSASVNNSFNSLDKTANTATPEPRTSRDRGESNAQNARPAGAPTESPYPWSSRRLNFTSGNPFPRYGAAINATASKDGTIYLMGGLVGGSAVKGDLWLTEFGNGSMACYPISTTGDGPGPRVGHASLLVGNAFIVFGGDTKLADNDELDDTLYLLNTSTKHWSRALPQGPRPTGRYGHTLNILGSKIYIFGGQVEEYFFNDLVAFDLNSLQSSASRWEVLLPSSRDQTSAAPAPPARTNHSVVTWNDKLYLFGGTDGVTWFNDVWTYEPRSNTWTELDCIGYIPVAREGHSAALVNDTMYIFGGRTQEGVDLGDLAAFRISSRRWYMFQNMGHSPSARSGHSMTALGKHIVVMAGEPSSSVSDRNELSLAYFLDISKIRYPPNETAPPQQQQNQMHPRNVSGGERSNIPQSKMQAPATRESVAPGSQAIRGADATGGGAGVTGSRLPRIAGQGPAGPPPMQQPPQPKANAAGQSSATYTRNRTPTREQRSQDSAVDNMGIAGEKESPPTGARHNATGSRGVAKASDPARDRVAEESLQSSRSSSIISRNTSSRSHRPQYSQESMEQAAPQSFPEQTSQNNLPRESDSRQVENGGQGPTLGSQHDKNLARELEQSKSRNAWYASELALARKAGYNPGSGTGPVLDERSADSFRDEDRPLLEVLLRMKAELERVQNSIASQGEDAAKRIAEVEKQRDAAINEAIYAKTKLAAHGGGSQNGTPQPDGSRDLATPDIDRIQDINRRLAASLAAQKELSTQLARVTYEADAEKKARQLAEETAEAAQKRVQELDLSRHKAAAEFESLRAELHEAERVAREVSASAAEAETSSKLLAVDKQELSTKVARISEESKSYAAVVQSLHNAVAASSEKTVLLEKQLEEERYQADTLRQKLAQLRAEHELRVSELDATSVKLRDAESLAEKHAEEARLHQQAVLSGLGKITGSLDKDQAVIDERVNVLQQQLEASNAMSRKNQAAADQASEKLRRAEERIAGLEAYQEQSSRDGLSIRKQLQQTMRDMHAMEAEKADSQQRYERLRLDSNAYEVQLRSLKNLLEERGINAVDARRSRVLDSPNSRFGTPELNRVRELEQQIDSMNKAHEEMRMSFEQREHEVSIGWEEKLQNLHNDHQAAVNYLHGTEKMLTKLNQELDRHKTTNSKLEEELAQVTKQSRAIGQEQWDKERMSLRSELTSHQESTRSTIANLETQIAALRSESQAARQEVEAARKLTKEAESSAAQTRSDLEALRRQHAKTEERAHEAESRVQMFLDQFESSVDNYRRQSQLPLPHANGEQKSHRTHDSLASVDSLYSDTNPADANANASANHRASANMRNSVALDSLASELDALRSHWETTNKSYRLSDQFDFEKPAGADKTKAETGAPTKKEVQKLEALDELGGEEGGKVALVQGKSGAAVAAS